jgi:hypothetical protein
MGLDRDRWYVSPKGGGFDPNTGTFTISRRLAPWSAQVAEVWVLESVQKGIQSDPHAVTKRACTLSNLNLSTNQGVV